QPSVLSPRTSDRITRRSQVQILPPLLEKPRKRGFSVLLIVIGGPNFCPAFAFTRLVRSFSTSVPVGTAFWLYLLLALTVRPERTRCTAEPGAPSAVVRCRARPT